MTEITIYRYDIGGGFYMDEEHDGANWIYHMFHAEYPIKMYIFAVCNRIDVCESNWNLEKQVFIEMYAPEIKE